MYPFPLFETILILDGKVQNIDYHQQRYEYALKNYFRAEPKFVLKEIIAIPAEFKQGKVRCRIDYNQADYQVAFYAYQAKQTQRLECIFTENLDYHFKYANREKLNQLKPENCDEVIIINNGFVSDCTIGNLLFFKAGKWYSPNHYLLKGTQLSRLIDEGRVTRADIRYSDLASYEKVMIINALNPFEPERAIELSHALTHP